MHKKVGPRQWRGPTMFDVGGDLLSHTLTSAVPSALEGLASGFGMGPGVTPPPKPPTTILNQSPGDETRHRSRTHHPTPPAPQDQGRERRTWLCAQGHTVDANNKTRAKNTQSLCCG